MCNLETPEPSVAEFSRSTLKCCHTVRQNPWTACQREQSIHYNHVDLACSALDGDGYGIP
jgi:hypothetical protein